MIGFRCRHDAFASDGAHNWGWRTSSAWASGVVGPSRRADADIAARHTAAAASCGGRQTKGSAYPSRTRVVPSSLLAQCGPLFGSPRGRQTARGFLSREGAWRVEYWRAVRHRVSPRTNPEVSGESGKGIRRGILDVTRIVRHFRGCLQHNRCGGNHPRLEGGELSVGHVAEPFRDRVGRKM